MSKGVVFPKLNGEGLKIGIVRARWNGDMVDALFEQAKKALIDSGVDPAHIVSVQVPGSYEVVYGAASLLKKYKLDAVVCLGVLIKGETMHFEYIADAVTQGIMRLNLESGTPVIFGILACLTEAHAYERSLGEKSHGYNWGLSAVEMALLKKRKR